MTSSLFTIGFTKKTAAEFFALLESAGARKVVDIRENPGGQLSGFAKHPDLAFFLDRLIGAEYMREPLLAPSPEIREAYKLTRDWQRYEDSFLALMRERGVPGLIEPSAFEGRVALLCSEASPEKCHRRLVAGLLAEHWSKLGHTVTVMHLVTERPPGLRKATSQPVMPEIVLSDITVMGQGYCVIGLKQLAPGSTQSVRLRPPWGYAWRHPFEWQRGEGVHCALTCLNAAKPHIEDHQSSGLSQTGASLSEGDLIRFLNYAEVSADLRGLFGCALRSDTRGGNWWADSVEASRSICGCWYTNIWFQVFEEPERLTLRARMALPSNERLNSVPVVDREWRRFLREMVTRIKNSGRPYGAEQYLNRFVRRELMRSSSRFARLGLARPATQSGKCWLMLDSLFPQPSEAWLSVSGL